MTRDEIAQLLRDHKHDPTKTRFRTSDNAAVITCYSGCKFVVPIGESVARHVEDHQADMIAEAIDIEEYDNYLARRALTQLPGLIP